MSRVNPLHATGLFRHPLKTSENPRFFWCFQGESKETSDIKWVNSVLGSNYDLINCYLWRIQRAVIIKIFNKDLNMVNNNKFWLIYLMIVKNGRTNAWWENFIITKFLNQNERIIFECREKVFTGYVICWNHI